MADFFNKVKKGLNKGTTVLSVKSSTLIETNKLKSEISSLQKNKKELFTEIGQKIYELKKNESEDTGVIEELVEKIEQIDTSIELKQKDIEELLKKQEEILKSGDNEDSNTGSNKCECGAEISSNAKFCVKCGRQIVKKEQEINGEPEEVEVVIEQEQNNIE